MQVDVNGKRRNLNCRSAFEARAKLGIETDIVILNGFQIDNDCPLAENDTLVMIRQPCCRSSKRQV